MLKVTHVLDDIPLGDYAVKRVGRRQWKRDANPRLPSAITTNT